MYLEDRKAEDGVRGERRGWARRVWPKPAWAEPLTSGWVKLWEEPWKDYGQENGSTGLAIGTFWKKVKDALEEVKEADQLGGEQSPVMRVWPRRRAAGVVRRGGCVCDISVVQSLLSSIRWGGGTGEGCWGPGWLRGGHGALNQGQGYVPLVAPLLDNWHEFNPECNPKSHALIAWWEGPQVLPLTILARDLTPQTNRAITPNEEGSQHCFRSWKSFWSS